MVESGVKLPFLGCYMPVTTTTSGDKSGGGGCETTKRRLRVAIAYACIDEACRRLTLSMNPRRLLSRRLLRTVLAEGGDPLLNLYMHLAHALGIVCTKATRREFLDAVARGCWLEVLPNGRDVKSTPVTIAASLDAADEFGLAAKEDHHHFDWNRHLFLGCTSDVAAQAMRQGLGAVKREVLLCFGGPCSDYGMQLENAMRATRLAAQQQVPVVLVFAKDEAYLKMSDARLDAALKHVLVVDL